MHSSASPEPEKDTRILVSECQRIAEQYGATEVILIARVPDEERNIKIVTYGATQEACGFAAMAGAQLGAVLERQPRSLKDALEVANKIRPDDVV